jgi:hypothetical protein
MEKEETYNQTILADKFHFRQPLGRWGLRLILEK